MLINFYEICNENFEFCTRLYTRSTRNGIEIVFNNQTVPILVQLLKTVCGIDLLSFNNLLRCLLNPIDSLIDRCENMSDVTCRDHFAVFNWLMVVSRRSRSFLGFALGLRRES